MLTAPPAYVTTARDPTDVVGRRIAALVIDWGIAIVMIVVLSFSLASTREFASAARAEAECDAINEDVERFCVPVDDTVYIYDGGDLAAIILLPLAYHFLNDALLTGVTGFSLGKGIVGLRVIRQSDGRLAGVGRCMLRWLLWIVDGAPYCLPLVGLITGLVTKGHRRVGDMAASTLVVDKSDVGVVPVVPGLTPMAPTAAWPGQPQWGAPSQWGQPPQWGAPPPWGQPPSWGPPGTPPPSWGPPPTPQWGPPAAPPPPGHQPGPPQPTWAPPVSPTPTADVHPPAPAPEPAPEPEHEHAPTTGTPGVDSPLWDDARDTYIQWDPDLAAWVQWDDDAKEWRPIV